LTEATKTLAPAPRRSAGHDVLRGVGRRSRPLLFALAVIGLWELVSRADTNRLPRHNFPAPSDIAVELYDQAQTAAFWKAIEQTLEGWLVGLAIATVLGILLGVLIGSSRPVYKSVQPVIELLRPIPSIAVIPLLILVIGIELKLKLFVIVVACFWPILVQTIYGVQDVDPQAREMARVYGLGRVRIFAYVVIPSAAPYIVTGIRLAAATGLNVAIAIELLIGATHGIGEKLGQLQIADRVPALYAYIVVAGLLGLLMNSGIRRVERRVLRWHPSQRKLVPL
jgi:ABC-type nitrate/sulfonate/bicarbonate transport system permease component